MEQTQKTELWKRRFFEAQAAAEEFIVGSYGDQGVSDWIEENAKITARLLKSEHHDLGRKHQFMARLFRQLTLYESKISKTVEAESTTIHNSECGILKYRRRAESRGVKLTFKSPCDYCQKLNKGIFRQLTETDDISCTLDKDGCIWTTSNG